MRLGGSRQRLGNGGCRQRVYDAGNRLTGGRKRRSTCISAGPCGWSAAEYAGRHAEALPPVHFQSSDGGLLDFPEWVLVHPGFEENPRKSKETKESNNDNVIYDFKRLNNKSNNSKSSTQNQKLFMPDYIASKLVDEILQNKIII